MRGLLDGQVRTFIEKGFGEGREMELQGLAVEGPNDVQADGAADGRAELVEKKEAERGDSINREFLQDCAENHREMARQIVQSDAVAERSEFA